MDWKEINTQELGENPFSMIGERWMLITAGDERSYNTMTASWGGLGVLWGEPVAFIFVRPTRYTYEFIEREERLSLSFYPLEQREALAYCGKHSGREGDKAKACGLTPVFSYESPFFAQADTVLLCEKCYAQDLDPRCFLDPALEKWYQNDYHRMYVVKIRRVLVRRADK